MNRLLLIIPFVLFVAKASLGLKCNECKELDDNDFCRQDVESNWKSVPCNEGYCVKTTETTDHGNFVKRYCGRNKMPFEDCRDPDALKRFGRNMRGSVIIVTYLKLNNFVRTIKVWIL